MTKRTKNRIVTLVALSLIAVAVFLAVQLMLGNEGMFADKPEETYTQPTTVFSVPETESETADSDIDSKYLWEYGGQKISHEQPSESPEAVAD